jgi:hypothetical protein
MDPTDKAVDLALYGWVGAAAGRGATEERESSVGEGALTLGLGVWLEWIRERGERIGGGRIEARIWAIQMADSGPNFGNPFSSKLQKGGPNTVGTQILHLKSGI